MLNFSKSEYPEFNFHITRKARDKYKFDDKLFSISGKVIFSDFKILHRFVNRYNEGRTNPLSAGDLNAMGLMDEVYHYMIEQYRIKQNPNLFKKVEKALSKWFGAEKLDNLLETFSDKFPDPGVYKNKVSSKEYLEQVSSGMTNRHRMLEELLVLWIENRNPAFNSISD